MAECMDCAKPLSSRNTSGYCARCIGRHVAKSDDVRAKISVAMKRRYMANPQERERAAELVRRAHACPKAVARRKERWAREKPWIKGNACQPAGSESRMRAGAAAKAMRLAWCPAHLRETYLFLTRVKRLKAAEARAIVLEQDALEVAKLRRVMNYIEPEPEERAPLGRPPVWGDCPDELKPEYDRLRRRGVAAAEARALLEKAA